MRKTEIHKKFCFVFFRFHNDDRRIRALLSDDESENSNLTRRVAAAEKKKLSKIRVVKVAKLSYWKFNELIHFPPKKKRKIDFSMNNSNIPDRS